MRVQGNRRVAGVVATGIGAAALVSLLVMRTSDAVFTAQLTNTGNSFTAGNVSLSDGGAGTLFAIPVMEPGQQVSSCIDVTYGGSIPDPSVVRLYVTGMTESVVGFAAQLNLTVERLTGGCAGAVTETIADGTTTLAAFAGARTDYATGAGTWDPSGTPETAGYRFTVELDADTDNTFQNAAVTDTVLVWEVEN